MDGQENPINTIYTAKLYEVQKYITLTGHQTQNLCMIINEKFYQSLSPELKAVFDKTAIEAGDFQSDLQVKVNKDNLEEMKKKGVIVNTVNRARIRGEDEERLEGVRVQAGQGSLREDSSTRSRTRIRLDKRKREAWRSLLLPLALHNLSAYHGRATPRPRREMQRESYTPPGFQRGEEIASGALLVLMSLATFGNVVARYFFNNPIEWAEEFSRYAFIWIVFLGAVPYAPSMGATS